MKLQIDAPVAYSTGGVLKQLYATLEKIIWVSVNMGIIAQITSTTYRVLQ